MEVRGMQTQQKQTTRSSEQDQETADIPTVPAETKSKTEKLKADLDDILDDIESCFRRSGRRGRDRG